VLVTVSVFPEVAKAAPPFTTLPPVGLAWTAPMLKQETTATYSSLRLNWILDLAFMTAPN
jgi:hypothetical protein